MTGGLAFRLLPAFLVAALASACGTSAPRSHVRLSDGADLSRLGLASCDPTRPDIALDPDMPLTLLVHGCSFSNGRFRTLAQIFEAHGQQTICFNYNDRDSLEVSSGQLKNAITLLTSQLRKRELNIIGHSQGGLVAHRALIRERKDGAIQAEGSTLRLVTISSPFNGISASADCGSLTYHLLSLGVTAAICQIAAGSKWNEIHPRAEFIRVPGTLVEPVGLYLRVVTDERESCLRKDGQGRCAQKDFVFSVPEQQGPSMEANHRVTSREVKAGHSEVVGQEGSAPWKLIRVLQAEKILKPTPPEERQSVARLIEALFATPLGG
jgi:pimeloyl-ACP methyl ester carboxylesterase